MTLHPMTAIEAEQPSQADAGGDSDTGYRATARHQIETLEMIGMCGCPHWQQLTDELSAAPGASLPDGGQSSHVVGEIP